MDLLIKRDWQRQGPLYLPKYERVDRYSRYKQRHKRPSASVSLIQSNSIVSSGGVGSQGVAISSQVNLGDLILVGVQWGNQSGTFACADNQSGGSNTYTAFPSNPVSDTVTSGNEIWCCWGVATATSAGGLTVTVTITGGGTHTVRMAAYAYRSTTGWKSPTPIDQSNVNHNGSAGTSGTAGSVTPTVAGSLVWSAIELSGAIGSGTLIVNAPMKIQNAGGTNGNGWGSADRATGSDNTNSGTSAINPSYSWANSVGYAATVATFLPVPTGVPDLQFPTDCPSFAI